MLRMLPVELIEAEATVDADPEAPVQGVSPLYVFEPNIEDVLDVVLPKYIRSRIPNACSRLRPRRPPAARTPCIPPRTTRGS